MSKFPECYNRIMAGSKHNIVHDYWQKRLPVRIRGNSIKNPFFTPQRTHSPKMRKTSLKVQTSLNASGKSRIKKIQIESVLFILALVIYLATRLAGLSEYPIYFFTDEAVQTELAQQFVERGARGSDGQLFPTFFLNSYQYNLGASVYLQVIPYLIFGKSIYVTRAASMLVTALAAVWLGLILKRILGSTRPWLAILLLSIAPAWFLHSRTAFETALASSLYAGFLYYYLLYRQGEIRKLYLAVILGALTFYSYSPIRMVMGMSALFFFLGDVKYHLRHWKFVVPAFGLALWCSIPLLRFQTIHPTETLRHLQVLNTYWIQDIPFIQKLNMFGSEYLAGLNPLYWFFSNSQDLARHLMNGYGHVAWWFLPFTLLGLWVSIYRFKQPAYRIILFSLLAAPTGAALVKLGITRALVTLIPLTLLSAIGFNWLLELAANKWKQTRLAANLTVFSLLAAFNIFLCVQALTVGALWHQDYGLGGMQYGAKQLTSAINAYLTEHPGAHLLVSPSWANGTDTTMRFFYNDSLPFQMGSIEGYINERKDIENTLFVMIPEEFRQVEENPKFTNIKVEETLPYPNGQPGFYFVHLEYVDNIAQILAEEKAARKILQHEELDVQGVLTTVAYSYLDMGEIGHIFDGDKHTVIRTMEANPLQIQMKWQKPRSVEHILVMIGGTTTTLSVRVYNQQGMMLFEQVKEWKEDPNPRTVTVDFPEMLAVTRLEIDILNTYDSDPSHVHLWEITLQ